MIESFKSKVLQLYFEKGDFSRIKANHRKRVRLVLTLLHAASAVGDMKFPGSDLHPLKGERKGFWSVKISGNWRVIFHFDNGNVYDVDYLDYR